MESTQKSKSWFCVFNNPQKVYEGEPKDIAEKVLEIWLDNKPTRTGAVAYCISVGGLHHLHMVFEDSNMCRFSTLKKLFPEAHLEPTLGNKTQAEDYINKKGKFEEKGEQVLYVARFGEIKGRQGLRKDIEIISELIEQGMTPDEIYETDFAFRRYDSMIKSAYFSKLNKSTNFIRDIKVFWHIGESGSGKSYTAQKLIDEFGESNLFLLSDYTTGGFDNYLGQKILFMDEFRGQIRFHTLLTILDKYKREIHARYNNVYALWNEVHITSVLLPQECYEDITIYNQNKSDNIQQLLRRITNIVYHEFYNGEYRTFEIPMSEFKSYVSLKFNAHNYWNSLIINEDEWETV